MPKFKFEDGNLQKLVKLEKKNYREDIWVRVAKTEDVNDDMWEEFHIKKGHAGVTNGWQTLRRCWYFGRSDARYKAKKKTCECQRGKHSQIAATPQPPLKIIPNPEVNFSHVHVDLFGPYERSYSGTSFISFKYSF